MEKKRIAVGKVVSTHGHRGEVKVWPWTDFPERYRPGTRLFLAQGDTCLTVARSRQHGKSVIVQFAEIQDLTSAEKLRGAILEVEPWEVEPLPPGRYYIFQLVGCRVYTEEGELLGELRDVQQTGANDVFVVVTPEAGEVLIPAVKEVVREIDVEQGIIRVKPIPGLLD
ncbi:ribosome maturation factor RimM [Thermanaeromonas sp. C210]|uniref:ribosome maturation factor RimM n=1 Tax=Thermanaeromonas sp. C210 TaxID=2731925 RepID=UPI00155C3570|nr:ribosome maturation factor RimM [Thermanaeromonas sp. C210]GFN23959.1 ribosome maturation factor RimM [Thermanaeromonas sp. C210]